MGSDSSQWVFKAALLVLALVSIVTSIILYEVPESGYYYNLYLQLPRYFWALAILGLATSAVLAALLRGKGHLAKLAGLLVLVFFLQILLTPYFLGYLTDDRADAMYIPGEVHAIYSSGHFYQAYDKYPLVSILYSEIFMVVNVPYIRYLTLVPALFSVMFVFALYKILGEVGPEGRFITCLVLLMSVVYYGSYYQLILHPSWYAFTLSVLLIYLLISRRFMDTLSGELLIGIFVVTLPFAHPYYITDSIMFLAAMVVYSRIRERPYAKIYGTYLFVSTVIFLTWIIHNQAAYSSLQSILNALQHTYVAPAGVKGTEKASVLTRHDILAYAFGHVGRFSLILVLLPILFLFSRNKKRMFLSHGRLWYIINVLVAIQVSMLVLPIFAHNPDRYINVSYLSVALPMEVVIISKYVRWNRVLKGIALGFVVMALVTSVFALYYYPPISLRPNIGITSNEIVSTSFIFSHREHDVFVFSPHDEINVRYCEFRDLATWKACTYSNIRYTYWEVFPPRHFGYATHHRFTLLIPVDRAYIELTDYALQAYLYVPTFRRTHRITRADYRHMNADSHLDRVYTGLNVRVYLWSKSG